MSEKKPAGKKNIFEHFALITTKAAGSTPAFLIAFGLIIVWLVSGPLFGFSDTWQLVINTTTTIITFLMVFLIQKTQNKDAVALHIKLNELIVSQKMASNRIVSVEDLTEDELEILHKHYEKLAELARKQKGIRETHSQKAAERRHDLKLENQEQEDKHADKSIKSSSSDKK
jgi:low affinity Fe/Cu permease